MIALIPVAKLLHKTKRWVAISLRQRWLRFISTAISSPLKVTSSGTNFLPISVADHLLVGLALCGVIQITLLGVWSMVFIRIDPLSECIT